MKLRPFPLLTFLMPMVMLAQAPGHPAKPAEATVEVIAQRPIAEAVGYQSPVPEKQASALENFSYTIGNLNLRFEKGLACPLMVDGQARGLYIRGMGTFRYLAMDPVTRPLLQFNLKENTKLKALPVEGGLSVGEPITEVILWFLGGIAPTLPAPSVPAPREAFEATWKFFSNRDTAGFGRTANLLSRLPIGQLATYRHANAPETAVVSAEITGEKEKYLYTYDPVRSRLESLFIQRAMTHDGELQEVPLIAVDYAPLGWSRKTPPDPDFRLSHVDLDMVASNKTFAKYTVTETLIAIRPNLRMLSFHMSDSKVKSGAFGQVKLLKSGIQRILLDGMKELHFDQRGGFVLVDLGRSAKNGETLKLTFEVEGDLLGRVSNYDFWRLTPGEGWFPEPDMAGQSYTVKAKVAVEKPFVPIVSAKTIARTSTATHNVIEASLDKPTLWFSIAAGNYTPKEMIKDGRTVRAWGYAGIGKGAESLLKTTHAILNYYQYLLGTAPFDEINLVEVPSLGFGQAPAGMIWLTREAFDAVGDDVNRMVASRAAVGGWVNRLVSHEIAHQYWAHQVKMWGYEDQWITESFAEYTSSLAMRAMKNKGVGTYEIIVKDWAESAKKATNAATIPTATFLSPSENGDREHFAYRQWLVYNKGAYLLACLHSELGEEKFVQFLRGYQKSFPWYPPSFTQDVPDLLKAITGKDYNEWMNKYFWGTGLPERKS